MKYWLMKSEPGAYSIDDLARDGLTCWDGVRNYEARNHMRDMVVGDKVLFYHSNAKPPGVVGTAKVCQVAYPDDTAFDPKHKHFDPKSDPEDPTWLMVDIEFASKLARTVAIQELRDDDRFADMPLLRPFQRLSVQPVSKAHFAAIVTMGRA